MEKTNKVHSNSSGGNNYVAYNTNVVGVVGTLDSVVDDKEEAKSEGTATTKPEKPKTKSIKLISNL
jgi:hypothetical protein